MDELVKWADYFYSDEGSILYNMGVEGVTFEFDENGVPQFKDELINNPDGLTLTQMRVKYMGFQSGPGYWSDETYKGAETYWTSTELMDDYRQYLPEEIWESFNATYEPSGPISRPIWTRTSRRSSTAIALWTSGTTMSPPLRTWVWQTTWLSIRRSTSAMKPTSDPIPRYAFPAACGCPNRRQ